MIYNFIDFNNFFYYVIFKNQLSIKKNFKLFKCKLIILFKSYYNKIYNEKIVNFAKKNIIPIFPY